MATGQDRREGGWTGEGEGGEEGLRMGEGEGKGTCAEYFLVVCLPPQLFPEGTSLQTILSDPRGGESTPEVGRTRRRRSSSTSEGGKLTPRWELVLCVCSWLNFWPDVKTELSRGDMRDI